MSPDISKDRKRPQVGISQCLLGDTVRYDGKSKANKIVLENLTQLFDLVPVCPEVEAGLSTPRPPVQLTSSIEKPNLTGRDDPLIDITNVMQRYCDIKPGELDHLVGFVFKSRSPSCGLNSTPVFINKKCVTENGRGLFAKKLCLTYPELVVIEDHALEDNYLRKQFIQQVYASSRETQSA